MRQQPATITTVTIALTFLLLGVPAIGRAQALSSVQLNQTTITSGVGAPVTGTVSLDRVSSRPVRVGLRDNADSVTVQPSVIIVPAGALVSPPFTVTTTPVAVHSLVTITALTEDGVTKTAQLTILRPVLTSLGLLPTTATGGMGTPFDGAVQVTARVLLSGPAPTNGFSGTLSSDKPLVAKPQNPEISVPAGATFSAEFPITSFPVGIPTTVTFTANVLGVPKTAQLTVLPPVLVSVGVLPTSIKGGTSGVTVRVLLNGPAPTNGFAVELSSDKPQVAQAQQPEISVPGGARFSAEFPITTFPVTTPTTVTITANSSGDGGVPKTVLLTITP